MCSSSTPTRVRTEGQEVMSFGSADACVLDELATNHPGVHAMFPYYLSHQCAINKDFMSAIISNAVREMGPGAAAEVMRTEHAARWPIGGGSRRRSSG